MSVTDSDRVHVVDDVTHREVTAPSEPRVRMSGLCKRFRREDGTVVDAIDDVNIDVGPGEFLVLLGPSGCGKTTLLRSLAGVERPDIGAIEIDGRVVFSSETGTYLPPERRRIGMMFQSFALWPHMTVFQNVAYPLQTRRVAKREIAERVRETLGVVGIPQLERQYPGQMSGGQQQRVALARALVADDDVILFDEPLSSVDAKVREQLRYELLQVQEELGFTAIYVTHDQAEAMELASRIAVMREGAVAQLGDPRTIYDAPTSRYVARFVGTTNEISGSVGRADSTRAVITNDVIGEIVVSGACCAVTAGQDVSVLARPEQWVLGVGAPPDDPNVWSGTVVTSQFVGPYTDTLVRVGGELEIRLWYSDSQRRYEPGTDVWVSIAPDCLMVLDS